MSAGRAASRSGRGVSSASVRVRHQPISASADVQESRTRSRGFPWRRRTSARPPRAAQPPAHHAAGTSCRPRPPPARRRTAASALCCQHPPSPRPSRGFRGPGIQAPRRRPSGGPLYLASIGRRERAPHPGSCIGDYTDPVPGTRGVQYLIAYWSPAENSGHLRTNGFRAHFRKHRCRHASRTTQIQVSPTFCNRASKQLD